MIAVTSSTTLQSLVQIEQHTSMWGDKIIVLRFCVTLTQCVVGNVVITSTRCSVIFSGPILTRFASFLKKKSPLQQMKEIWKLSLGGASTNTIGAIMREEIFKIWENRCKVYAHHFDYLKVIWRNTSTTALYRMYCRCAPV